MARFCRAHLLAFSLGVFFLILWVWILLYKYYYFQYYDWDLAFFNQAMWNLLSGRLHVSLFGIPFFANHSNFFALLLLPLYAVFPHPLTLVFLKLLAYLSAGFVFYYFVQKRTGKGTGLLFMLLYLVSLPNIYGVLYEFHFESLSPVMLFLLFYFFSEKRIRAFWITSALLMTLKENMPLVVAVFGVCGLLSGGRSRLAWGVIPLGVSLAVFFLLTARVIPAFSGTDAHPYLGHYAHLGAGSDNMVLGAISRPGTIFRQLALEQNGILLLNLFLPFLFLPLLCPRVVLLCAPVLFQHLLSNQVQEHSIYYHYMLPVMPFLFLAFFFVMRRIDRRLKQRRCRWAYYVLLLMFVGLHLFNIWWHEDNIDHRIRHYETHGLLNRNKWELVGRIPRDAPAAATFAFLPELSARRYLYALHMVYDDFFHSEGRAYVLPAHVGYALVDFSDGWLTHRLYLKGEEVSRRVTRRVRAFLEENPWAVTGAAGDVVLLERKRRGAGEVLWEERPDPFAGVPGQAPRIVADGLIECVVAKNPDSFRPLKGVEPLSVYWKAREEVADKYRMVFSLVRKGREVEIVRHDVGYGVYQSDHWRPDRFYRENFWLQLPETPPGEYLLFVGLENISRDRMAELESSQPDLLHPQKHFQNILTLTVQGDAR